MTQPEQPRSGGFMLFLAFMGGAVVGGAAALLLAPHSGATTRRRLAGAVEDGKDAVSRVPQAIRDATVAAQQAFTEALEQG